MRFSYDSAVDALDIKILEGSLVSRTEQIDAGTLVDLDAQGHVLSIEVIRPARRWPLDEILARFDVSEEHVEVLRSFWAEPKAYPFAEPADFSSTDAEILTTA